MIDVVEVLQHGMPAGRSRWWRQVWGSTQDGPQVRGRGGGAGLVPGGPPLGRAEWAGLVRGWFPELVDARVGRRSPVIEEHRARIGEMLKSNTVTTVHQRLRDEHGLAVGILVSGRYVDSEFPDESSRDRVTGVAPRRRCRRGSPDRLWVLGFVAGPLTGRARRVWAFVMVLACSWHMFVRPVLSMDARSWVASHVAGFAFFGVRPADLCPTTWRPVSTNRICMTRRSTGRMGRWPSTTAVWSTRPGCVSRPTRLGQLTAPPGGMWGET